MSQNADLLWLAQDLSYWQPGRLFWQQSLSEPGGVFSWLGCYLTQFFHIPALGASMLIVMWIAISACIMWGCRLRWWLSWFAFLPSLMLLWAETSMSYEIYVSKVPDWWFTPTLATLVAAVAVLVCRWFAVWVRCVLHGFVLVALLVAAGMWVSHAHVPERLRRPFAPMVTASDFHAQMQMSRAADECRWTDIQAILRTHDEKPTRAMLLFNNISLLHQDRLHTDWLRYPVQTKLPDMSSDSVFVIMAESVGPQLYFLYGNIGFSYRWSMENMVEFGTSASRLRNMAMCALVMGEDALATHYLDLLSGMIFQREWAEQQRQYVGHPELLASAEAYSIPLAISRQRTDYLDSDDGKVEKYLLDTHSYQYLSDDEDVMKLNMMFALQSQDIRRFWNHFFHYANTHLGEPMPRLYQEAAWLYGKLEPQTVDVSQMPFDNDVIQTHERFMQATSQHLQRGMSEQAVASATRREFGNTFFWFYFFCRGEQLY